MKANVGGTVAIVCLGGPVRKIYVRGRMWHFEMHSFLGPMPVHKKTGTGIDGSKAFWEEVSKWAQQGQRVDDTGVCLYDSRRPVR